MTNNLQTKGVILQDRNIIDNPIMSSANAFQLYMYLKLRAEYKKTGFYFGYKKINLEVGQLLIRQSVVAKQLKMPKGSIKKVLTTLEGEGLICINKTTNKYTIITVLNYTMDFREYKQNKNKTKTKQKQNKSVSTNSPNSLKSPKLPKGSKIYGRPDINECFSFFEDKLEGPLDDSQAMNRRYCKLLLDKLKKSYPKIDSVKAVKTLIQAGLIDDFHGKNVTSFKYLYYNGQKIIRSAKRHKLNSQVLTL